MKRRLTRQGQSRSENTGQRGQSRVYAPKGRGRNYGTVPMLLIALLLLVGCGAPATDLSGVQVLYSGPAYGDFIEIASSIKQCMHSDIETLPTLTIVSGNFRCNTPGGWVDDAWGCYANGEATVSLPRLELTHGQAWAHELTHFYGDLSEGNGCGNFFYSGFDWQKGK